MTPARSVRLLRRNPSGCWNLERDPGGPRRAGAIKILLGSPNSQQQTTKRQNASPASSNRINSHAFTATDQHQTPPFTRWRAVLSGIFCATSNGHSLPVCLSIAALLIPIAITIQPHLPASRILFTTGDCIFLNTFLPPLSHQSTP